MDLSPLQPRIRADQLPLERLAENARVREKEKVAEVARQFEAVLLRKILEKARKSMHDDALGESSAALG